MNDIAKEVARVNAIIEAGSAQMDDDGNEIVVMATCGTCGRSWNDERISGLTPTPSGRCPYEYAHDLGKLNFGKHSDFGDTSSFMVGDVTVTARLEHDLDSSIDDDDCHNVDQSVTGCDDEQQAKLIAVREAYFRDEWHYVGIVIDLERDGWTKPHAASLWGLEMNYPGGDNSYLADVAEELAREALDEL